MKVTTKVKNILLTALLIISLNFSVTNIVAENNVIQKISKQTLTAVAKPVDTDLKQEDNSKKKKKSKKKKYDFSTKEFSKYELLKSTYSFIEKFGEQENLVDNGLLEINNFWFPSVLNQENMTPENIVTNSVTMDKNLKNILLTGPNQGGKSVILKSIVTAAILAQSLCIAPCEHMRFTPFSKIMTFLNVTDDTSKGISLFNAYLTRGKQLIEEVEKLPAYKHGLFIADEPFNGTEPRETIKGAAYMAGTFALKDNCLSIVSTHFDILTELEEETGGIFKNFTVIIARDKDNKIIYTYRWRRGRNRDHIGSELMRKRGLTNPDVLGLVEKFSEKIEKASFVKARD